MSQNRRIICLTLPGYPEPSLAIAASRAGALGVLDLEYSPEMEAALAAVARLVQFGKGARGVKLDLADEAFASALLQALPAEIGTILIAHPSVAVLPRQIEALRQSGRHVLVEATDAATADAAAGAGAAGVVLKGNEAGGRVGEETAFVLLQRCAAHLAIPLWVQGGIGVHAAAACIAGGAAGVVLDWQLALTRESPLPQGIRERLSNIDGSETITVEGGSPGESFRIYHRPGLESVETLLAQSRSMAAGGDADGLPARWRATLQQHFHESAPDRLLLLSQDAAFAAGLARRHRTVAGIVHAVEQAISGHLRAAQEACALAEQSPLALSHGTRYPILQGPMTRVSDVAPFCEAVAEGGALPFLALALMRAPQVETLLQQTKERMGDRPWGVGILGFVPLELRQEQIEIIRRYRPPFAIIAGGRPDQAARLEEDGIATYLHVPSPGLLELFIKSGRRRFIFEGRECGGHVGPRSSFVLWQSMIDLLASQIDAGHVRGTECHIVFAGGIHDARSAAMTAVMASPLTARGVKIGVLMGTAYLFTAEAVACGAIREQFQRGAIAGTRTVLLETGPGHAIRCLDTPYVAAFQREKQRVLAEKCSNDEVRATLEELNLGRLRIASKGVRRDEGSGGQGDGPRYVEVSAEEQYTAGMYMSGQIAALRHGCTTIEELHREVAVAGTAFLKSAAEAPAEEAETGAPCDIAIIGMSTLLPKASTLLRYWENIVRKVDAIEEVPKDRWDPADYFDPDRTRRDRVYSRWGGFLEAIPFDPAAYGMPPNSVPAIEPLQLLTLEAARAALADAGYADRPFERERAAVILGVGGGAADLGQLYGFRSTLPLFFGENADAIVDQLGRALPEWSEDSFAGILMNVAAGRVANRLDLGGANFTVDAACASSLAAVYLAVRELEAGTSDLALVGGADTMQGPFAYVAFSKTQALSPGGRCRTFDESADGIAISEGVAMLVLKRRDDAERDGDRIYAVIRGIGASSDGRDKGLTAPRPEGQVRALERAYARAGISPATVGLIEAHGTGTVAGDRAEVQALTRFFVRRQAEPQSCAIGSVKSMIGHTKCTAGVAGLIKVALALHEAVLPPTLGVEQPNRHANFPATPFYVNSETRPWLRRADGTPRRGGVSAFGFGGTNFHVVLEEYTGAFLPATESTLRNWPSELFLWSAPDRAGLLEAIRPVERALASGATPLLADLAFTVCSRAEAGESRSSLRLAIVAQSLEELGAKLGTARAMLADCGRSTIADPTGIFFSESPLAREGRLAFLFPGQGSQYPDMGRDLALYFPEARASYEEADGFVAGRYDRPLSAHIFPPPTFTEEEARANRRALTDTHVAQPALGAMAAATSRVLRALGVAPEMAGGHSYGEFVALWAAGVLDGETLFQLSEARGRFIRDSSQAEPGTMVAVEADAATVRAALAGLPEVVCANLNAPQQTVIAGPQAATEQAIAVFNARGIRARALPVACAFHSPLVAGAGGQLAEALASVAARSPSIPVYSNTTGSRHGEEPERILALLAEHLVRPVEFMGQVEAMYADGARIFVEVGPRGVLTRLVGQILAGRPHAAIATDQEGRSGLYQLQLALARLAAEGVELSLARLFAGRALQQLDLEKLDRSSAALVYAPTTWLVNGSRSIPARDAGQPVPSRRVDLQRLFTGNGSAAAPHAAEGKMMSPISHPEALGANTLAVSDGAPANPPKHGWADLGEGIPANPIPAAVTPAAPTLPLPTLARPGARPDAAAMVAQFQQVMSRFLDTQRAVMLAYLGAAPVAPSISDLGRRPADLAAVGDGTGNGASATESGHGVPAVLSPPFAFEPAIRTPESGAASADIGDSKSEIVPPAVREELAAPPITRDAVAEQLLAIVAERTGYPTDMLGLELDLEADLGIDSIKRVEIFGMLLQQRGETGERSEAAMEGLANLKTLSGIIDWVLEQAPSVADGGSRSMDSETDAGGICRATVRVVAAPPANRDGGLASGVLVVTDDGRGIAATFARGCREAGLAVALVRPGEAAAEIEPGVYDYNFASPEAAQALAGLVQARQGAAAGIIHLLPLRPAPKLQEMELPEWRGRLEEDVAGLFHIARAFAGDLHAAARQGGAVVLAITGMGGTFGLDGSPDLFAGHGGVAGLAKTLALEWPEIRVRALDLDPHDRVEACASHVQAELFAGDMEREIGYRAGQRIRLSVEPAPLAPGREDAVIGPESVILLTGGARGITAEVAVHLARRCRPTLLLAGRSPEPPAEEAAETAPLRDAPELKAAIAARMRQEGKPAAPAQIEQEYRRLLQEREMRATLCAIEAAGGRVRYFRVDFRDESAVGRFLHEIYGEYGRLDGVIHGAGIIEDRRIEQKDPASFRRVFETKSDSAFLLARLLRFDQLRFLVFFSSASARFGNVGQGDYAAANEVLNKLACQLDRMHGTRVVAINWGPWASGGMVSPELERRFAARGILLIPSEVGTAVLEEEVRWGPKGAAEVVVTGGAWGLRPGDRPLPSGPAPNAAGAPVEGGSRAAAPPPALRMAEGELALAGGAGMGDPDATTGGA